MPVPVLESPKFQLNEYGVVPPEAVAVKVITNPPLQVKLKSTTKGWPETLTTVEATVLLPLASVTVKDSVNVPLTG